MRLRLASTALLLLAACGSQSSNREAANGAAPAGPTGAAAPAADAGGAGLTTIQPGEWEVTMAIRSTEMSGMPAGMRAPNIPPTTMRSCVTPEQVARGNAAFLSGGSHRSGVDCDYSRVTVSGGRIQGTSSCTGPNLQATVTLDGSFTPTSYEMDEQMESNVRGRTMRTTNHLSGHRIGDCAPGQENAGPAIPVGDRAGK
ncbi:MAG: DUF3617 domain-containing protein [Sphingomonadaceae bacterium]|nr:DUF3617 domain-containing protein [Sphingomonadaceae bacterium]